ncbi:diacylglycerol kinase [Flavobacterium sediminis]|uniref:Dihydrofolate reductase n=1 Tax=Flavobacterium sediminis TaxID=2201181 RepID=A0A2U8QT05_9FLAO|nr:dihydrofolate reductase [Flavobacterium sediminis]AWM13231.1 diacylglycerol kinase [Flavobacterium sediminis]
MREIIIIAAAAENNALGKDNTLVWHLPDDFKRFKALTSEHYIIMGRKTFESFPKPLPNRTHIIITRQKNYKVPKGCLVVSSIEEAISVCPQEENLFIIGGGEIYKQSMLVATKIELTRVHTEVEADTFFPEIKSEDWKLVEESFHPSDEKHSFPFTFLTYVKRDLSE